MVNAISGEQNGQDVAAEQLIVTLAKHYPNVLPGAASQLGLAIGQKFKPEIFLAMSVAANLTHTAQCII